MKKYGIPTAAYETFDDYEAAKAYLETCKVPVVIKADGLALGKGVLICNTRREAFDGLKEIMEDRAFGAAGNRVVIEEFLTGFEVSVLAFTDGETVVPMVSSQDHKRALDGDKGLNTGGMGTFSPSVRYTDEMAAEAYETIFLPTVRAMKAEGRTFKGVLYFGLMVCSDGIKVLEYNARFGDPETQVVLPRLKNDLFDVFEACIDGHAGQNRLSLERGGVRVRRGCQRRLSAQIPQRAAHPHRRRGRLYPVPRRHGDGERPARDERRPRARRNGAGENIGRRAHQGVQGDEQHLFRRHPLPARHLRAVIGGRATDSERIMYRLFVEKKRGVTSPPGALKTI